MRNVRCSNVRPVRGRSIRRHARIDALAPGLDAAGDVGDAGEATGAKKLGDAQATAAVVTVDEQVFVARQGVHVFGDLAHGDGFRAVDARELVFEGFAHIDESHRIGIVREEVAGLFDGNFQGGGVVHTMARKVGAGCAQATATLRHPRAGGVIFHHG